MRKNVVSCHETGRTVGRDSWFDALHVNKNISVIVVVDRYEALGCFYKSRQSAEDGRIVSALIRDENANGARLCCRRRTNKQQTDEGGPQYFRHRGSNLAISGCSYSVFRAVGR